MTINSEWIQTGNQWIIQVLGQESRGGGGGYLDLGVLYLRSGMFFSRPSPKAGRELQTELNTRIMNGGRRTLSEPEPVTGP